MAVVEERADAARLQAIVDEVARAVGRHSIKRGPGQAPAVLRITAEDGIRRVVQVYWTPFQIQLSGRCIQLRLDVAQPRPHWAEAFLSPEERNWVLCFYEREDGAVQLAHYRDVATPSEAIETFFDLAGWYVLTATDLSWSDVVYEVGPDVGWTERHAALSGTELDAAVQESLKKSTIMWLRWDFAGQKLTMPVWFVYDNKTQKIYVLSGEREQTLPGAEHMRECDVILRWKGKNARIAELAADVRVIPPGPEWDEVAEKVAEKRLNIPGLPEETARLWRDECVLLELTLRS